MSKLLNLKSWFSLADAVKRLNSSLEETISEQDLLQFALEGYLTIGLHLRNSPVENVAKACVVDPAASQQHSSAEQGAQSIHQTASVNFNNSTIKWLRTDDAQIVNYLNGPHSLLLADCPLLVDWLHALAFQSRQDPTAPMTDGHLVSDNEGNVWRLLQHSSVHVNLLPDGTMRPNQTAFFPNVEHPDRADLCIKRTDIEMFEHWVEEVASSSASQQNPSESATQPLQDRTTLLAMLGAIVDLMTQKDRFGKPNSVFKNKAALVAAIEENYSGVHGLSKRSVDAKLAEATHALTERTK